MAFEIILIDLGRISSRIYSKFHQEFHHFLRQESGVTEKFPITGVELLIIPIVQSQFLFKITLPTGVCSLSTYISPNFSGT